MAKRRNKTVDTPVKGTSAKGTSVEETSVEETPVEGTSVEGTSDEEVDESTPLADDDDDDDDVLPGDDAADGAEGKKKSKSKKSLFPPLHDKDGNKVKLVDFPTGEWQEAIHVSLKKGDFDEEWKYSEWQAIQLEAKAAKYRAEAEMVKKLGSKKERTNARKLINMKTKMAALTALLIAEGVDVDELLSEGDEDSDTDE